MYMYMSETKRTKHDQTAILCVCSSQIEAHCTLWLACCGTQELSNRSSSSEAFLGLKPQKNVVRVPHCRVGLALSRPNEYQPCQDCQANTPASS